ncbi:MAG: FecR domain-containing protein [Bdellovibrionales bacterium]|nr:FecR domain-containing protein [Bdellovibrionales bacterium]
MPKRSLVSTLGIFFLAASAGAPSSQAAEAELIHSKGEVQSLRAFVQKGDKVAEGAPVTTGKDASVILKWDNGVLLKLDSESTVVLKKSAGVPEVELTAGGLFAEVPPVAATPQGAAPKKGPIRFFVRTRSATMGVRGTKFYAAISQRKERKDLWMCVNEGRVGITDSISGKEVVVKAGQGVLVPEGKATTPPKAYPWTKKLNWNLNPEKGDTENKIDLKSAYDDLIGRDSD